MSRKGLVKLTEGLTQRMGEERFAKLEKSVHDLSRCDTYAVADKQGTPGEFQQEVYDKIYMDHLRWHYGKICK